MTEKPNIILKHTWHGSQQQLVAAYDPLTQSLEVFVDDDFRKTWATIMLNSEETMRLGMQLTAWLPINVRIAKLEQLINDYADWCAPMETTVKSGERIPRSWWERKRDLQLRAIALVPPPPTRNVEQDTDTAT